MNRPPFAASVFVVCASAAVIFLHHRPQSRITHADSVHYIARTPISHRYVVDPRAEAQALESAERRLAQLPDRLPHSIGEAESAWDLGDIQQSFETIAARYGPSARTYSGIGACALRAGHYQQAVQSFSQSLSLDGRSSRTAAGLRESRELLQVSRSIQHSLPRDEVIVRLRRYPLPAPGKSWIVLCKKSGPREPECLPCQEIGPLTLRLVVIKGARCRYLWSKTYGEHDVFAADIYVQDLAGIGTPQVAFYETLPGWIAEPTRVVIFAWKADGMEGGLLQALNLESTAPLWVEDIRHNGTYQVWLSEEIGSAKSGVEQPQWTDVYAWRRGRFRLADREYPGAYQHWVHDLRKSWKDHPRDADILAHLGATYAILGRQKAADRAFRAAERAASLLEDDYFAQIARAYAIAGRNRKAGQFYRIALTDCRETALCEKDPGLRQENAEVANRLHAEIKDPSYLPLRPVESFDFPDVPFHH